MSESIISLGDVLLLLIGAIIGLFSSIATLFIQNCIEKSGKFLIYTKFICLKDMGSQGWGVSSNQPGKLTLTIPAVFEIENTSKRARVMRDVSLVLIKESHVICKMTQINYLHKTTKTNNTITHEEDFNYGDDKGSYSFVIDPISIKRENCVYMYTISTSDIEKMAFDTIGLQFFDEKNKLHTYKIRNYNSWDIKNNLVDQDWLYIKDRIRIKS